MSLFDRYHQSIAAMILRAGRLVTWVKPMPTGDALQPWKVDSVTETVYPCYFLKAAPSRGDVADNMRVKPDRVGARIKGFIAPDTFAPEAEDYFEIDGKRFTCESFNAVCPGDTVLYYEIELVGA